MAVCQMAREAERKGSVDVKLDNWHRIYSCVRTYRLGPLLLQHAYGCTLGAERERSSTDVSVPHSQASNFAIRYS